MNFFARDLHILGARMNFRLTGFPRIITRKHRCVGTIRRSPLPLAADPTTECVICSLPRSRLGSVVARAPLSLGNYYQPRLPTAYKGRIWFRNARIMKLLVRAACALRETEGRSVAREIKFPSFPDVQVSGVRRLCKYKSREKRRYAPGPDQYFL